MNSKKEKYIQFCQEENIPLFSQVWWLDAVCGEFKWDVVLQEKGGNVVASMPYYLKENNIVMPPLTQTMGVYFKYPKNQKYYKKLSFEKESIKKLLEQLPKVGFFSQNFYHSFLNWLPFYWEGYEQRTRYTYVVENVDMETFEKNLETDIRRRRRKAEEFGVKVYESEDIETFYKVNKMTFERKNMKMPYSFEFVKNLHECCNKQGACKIFLAEDKDGNVIAGNFLVYDDSTVYYLMGGIDPEKRDLGGMDVILYESVKFALEEGKAFDFEGSMIESIEKYFRSFGAVQKHYFSISKTYSKMLRLKIAIKDVVKAIVR